MIAQIDPVAIGSTVVGGAGVVGVLAVLLRYLLPAAQVAAEQSEGWQRLLEQAHADTALIREDLAATRKELVETRRKLAEVEVELETLRRQVGDTP